MSIIVGSLEAAKNIMGISPREDRDKQRKHRLVHHHCRPGRLRGRQWQSCWVRRTQTLQSCREIERPERTQTFSWQNLLWKWVIFPTDYYIGNGDGRSRTCTPYLVHCMVQKNFRTPSNVCACKRSVKAGQKPRRGSSCWPRSG